MGSKGNSPIFTGTTKPSIRCRFLFVCPDFLKSRQKPVIPNTSKKPLYRTKHTSIYIICSNLKIFLLIFKKNLHLTYLERHWNFRKLIISPLVFFLTKKKSWVDAQINMARHKWKYGRDERHHTRGASVATSCLRAQTRKLNQHG
jgi:hypothetical protein